MPKIATAAYPLDWFDNSAAFEAKLRAWVTEAAGQGAELLVFPEYGAMELASLAGADQASDVEGAMRAVSAVMPEADALLEALARQYGVTILGASAPVFAADQADERPVNRARLFGPDGPLGHQDKRIMTMYERDPMDVRQGGPLQVFDTPAGRLAVLICYDAEFPLLGRQVVEAGAEILLVPSCTEALAGYWRVRVGAMARALEGQCVAVHAPTVGAADWCPIADANTGAAAVYGPPDLGFPATGVLAEGGLNRPGWVYADLPRGAVARVRSEGRVRNFAHWGEQF